MRTYQAIAEVNIRPGQTTRQQTIQKARLLIQRREGLDNFSWSDGMPFEPTVPGLWLDIWWEDCKEFVIKEGDVIPSEAFQQF